MSYHYLYYLIINFFVGAITLYIALKTKYLDFIIDPSSRFYKKNFKTPINNSRFNDQKRNRFITKNINQINKNKENIFQKTNSNAVISHKSVFYKLYSLIILVFSSGIITYCVFFKNKVDNKNLISIFFLIFFILFFFYFIRFLCYCYLDIYLFSSFISKLFSILISIIYGILISCLYILQYNYLSDINSPLSNKILNYFILLFIIFPAFLTLMVVFFVSFLYKNNKIKVNDKFYTFLKKLFIISFFIGTSFLPKILKHNSLFILILDLADALFFVILYSLVWVNTLNQLDRFIEQKIPKKCEWLLVFFLLESILTIFGEILYMIVRIVNYFLKNENKN